jgi:hypothetical protein
MVRPFSTERLPPTNLRGSTSISLGDGTAIVNPNERAQIIGIAAH